MGSGVCTMIPVTATDEQVAYWAARDGFHGQRYVIGGPEEGGDVIPCPALSNPSNGMVDDGTNVYDTTAAYTCNSGYEVTGGTTVRCSASGTWTGTPPTCGLVSCATRTAPTNGTIAPTSGPYVFGDSITYACNMGYSLSGGTAMQDCHASSGPRLPPA